MDIDADTLAVALSDEFEDCEIKVDKEQDRLVISERPVAAGMYFPEYYDAFIKRVERFLMMHTVEWDVISSHCNTIEGYHVAVLGRTETDT